MPSFTSSFRCSARASRPPGNPTIATVMGWPSDEVLTTFTSTSSGSPSATWLFGSEVVTRTGVRAADARAQGRQEARGWIGGTGRCGQQAVDAG